jgi:hypothetical protein
MSSNLDFYDIKMDKFGTKLRYIDNTLAIVEGKTLEENTRQWKEFMEGEGAFNWSRNHNSKFELSKLVLIHFNRKPNSQTQAVTHPKPSLK